MSNESKEKQEIVRRWKPIIAGCMARPELDFLKFRAISGLGEIEIKQRKTILEMELDKVRYPSTELLIQDVKRVSEGGEPDLILHHWKKQGIDSKEIFNKVFKFAIPYRDPRVIDIDSQVPIDLSQVMINTQDIPDHEDEKVTDEITQSEQQQLFEQAAQIERIRDTANETDTANESMTDSPKPKRSCLGTLVAGSLLLGSLGYAATVIDRYYPFLDRVKITAKELIEDIKKKY